MISLSYALLHGAVFYLLDLEVPVDAVPGDGDEHHDGEGATDGNRRRLAAVRARAAGGADVFWKQEHCVSFRGGNSYSTFLIEFCFMYRADHARLINDIQQKIPFSETAVVYW